MDSGSGTRGATAPDGPTMAAQAERLLSLRHVSKTFDGTVAVDDVSLDLAVGDVCGLVGPNGCGKSTLIKILAGVYRPDPGSEVELLGDEGTASMVFVHQDLGLVQGASVLENIALGTGYQTRSGWIRARAQREATVRLLEQFAVPVSPDALIGDLAPANRSLVAIARAFAVLQRQSAAGGGGVSGAPSRGLLVLDEPTASLTSEEADRVLGAATEVASRGNAVLFVSHRLDEILRVCTKVAVMRDGRIIDVTAAGNLSHQTLVELMLGRPVEEIAGGPPQPSQTTDVLEVRGLCGPRLRDVSVSVGAGEIVGVTGLLGSGKSELARMIAGAQEAADGTVIGTAEGERIDVGCPRDARRAGIAYLPPDRRGQGAILSFTATENLTLPDLRSFLRRRGLSHSAERRETLRWMDKVNVMPRSPDKPFATFSGGNQQKIVLAKWLRLEPRMLVLDEPTQAIDVGAVADIYRLITEYAERGLAVMVMSSEWEDLARICTRVYVLERGRVVAELHGGALTADGIGAAALGLHGNDQRLPAESDS
ncbi:MAG TPA: sugar ABC transporter ATP-binding protein [Baekduia sp.]|nr:sugar ABC transporter ATP-binding protein [Baekduia sp.]